MHHEIIEIGNPLLYQTAVEVTEFNAKSLIDLLNAMHALMDERNGVGIAAPQIGVSQQIMIIASRPNKRYPKAPLMNPLVVINPDIEWLSTNQIVDWEGCLSVPGLRGRVKRPDGVAVSFQNVKGDKQKITLDGFPARIFLHEYDHLIGKTFLDRVESAQDLYSEKEFLKWLDV